MRNTALFNSSPDLQRVRVVLEQRLSASVLRAVEFKKLTGEEDLLKFSYGRESFIYHDGGWWEDNNGQRGLYLRAEKEEIYSGLVHIFPGSFILKFKISGGIYWLEEAYLGPEINLTKFEQGFDKLDWKGKFPCRYRLGGHKDSGKFLPC